ncbi:MAG: hypothetical protein IH987_18430 [Planctomycetes bacterium]|nr:hypothetical protein [Planctomycetota bacterium]
MHASERELASIRTDSRLPFSVFGGSGISDHVEPVAYARGTEGDRIGSVKGDLRRFLLGAIQPHLGEGLTFHDPWLFVVSLYLGDGAKNTTGRS